MVNRLKPSSTRCTSQRAAIACQSCRLRKVKCDAQSVPSDEGCGPCRRAGQECLLDPLSDGRRSVSRKLVGKLQQRIETLEALNRKIINRSDWRPDEDSAVPTTDTSVLAGGSSTVRSVVTTDTRPPQSNDIIDPVLSRMSCSSHQSLPTSVVATGNSPETACHRSPSFYGATSHPHVVSPGEESRLTSFDELDAVGIDIDPTSLHLRDHLFQSFFKYQTLWVDIVNKESFFTHQANGNNSRWYSKFLENAMLACATRLSTSKSVRALGPSYCELAKDDVLRAMSEPTPANLQGFLLLSEYEVTQGNDRPGWMFCGVGCRMLSDLGLHELANTIDAPLDEQEPTKESDLAYALLSACVVYEGVWTLYLGRPSSIPRSVMGVVSARSKRGRKSDSPWLNAWVRLCVPMAEISHVLNDGSIEDSDRSNLLLRLFKQVEEWYESLPPELAYSEDRPTSTGLPGYGLHAQFCKVQILVRRALARPLNTRKRRYSQITSEKDDWTSTHDSHAMVYKYALRIARLVITYREAFGLEKIPSIMLDNAVLAATAMIEHLSKADNVNNMQYQMTWLRQLVKSLESMQPHFPIIGRMLDSLRQICGSGTVSNIFTPAHRDSTNAPAHDLSAPRQSLDVSSDSNNMQDNSIAVDHSSNFVWGAFDLESSLGVLPSGGFDDAILNLPLPEAFMSSLAQVPP
ncbi:fungal-specific transcription factor domain-containing protein [Thelonectria olida]|uniref:Fungal-specific transcription factor domain-containing protein n=1 Tax=Thelonectria olida TaxID=1576542 RepID=A0A9P9AK86_9HYPO|nr:fungal-specific transcription factor domain-containing protein [Thelonectria olida]